MAMQLGKGGAGGVDWLGYFSWEAEGRVLLVGVGSFFWRLQGFYCDEQGVCLHGETGWGWRLQVAGPVPGAEGIWGVQVWHWVAVTVMGGGRAVWQGWGIVVGSGWAGSGGESNQPVEEAVIDEVSRYWWRLRGHQCCWHQRYCCRQFGSIVVACGMGWWSSEAWINGVSICIAVVALGSLASSSSLSFWMGKVYPDFPFFCGPVGITSPSRVEVASRRYMVGGVVTREGCCWVCCCGNRCRSSYCGVKRKFFYACVCVCLRHMVVRLCVRFQFAGHVVKAIITKNYVWTPFSMRVSTAWWLPSAAGG